mmetsp:Transcript_46309/g.83522  ORF Transcript_46309/g.83522 Transcript_46309/m.83522 type:complete len:328 (+) Transcript_46309:348-1331(+)
MRHVALAPVNYLLLFEAVVLFGVSLENLSLNARQVFVLATTPSFFIHLLQQVGLVFQPHLLKPILLHGLGLKEVPILLLLLRRGALGIVVTGALLGLLNIVLKLLHQFSLALHALGQLFSSLLLLLIENSVVLLHCSTFLFACFPLLCLLLGLLLRILLEDLLHGFLCLDLFLLEAFLVGLHFCNDLLNQLCFLSLSLLLLLLFKNPLIFQLFFSVLLLGLNLGLLLTRTLLLLLLPTLKLHQGIIMVLAIFLNGLLLSLLLLPDLCVEIHLQLSLKSLDPKLLTESILLVQVGCILVKLGPVMFFHRRSHHVGASQRSCTAGLAQG